MDYKLLFLAISALCLINVLGEAPEDPNLTGFLAKQDELDSDEDLDLVRRYPRFFQGLNMQVRATRAPTPTLGPNPRPAPAPKLKSKKVITIEDFETIVEGDNEK